MRRSRLVLLTASLVVVAFVLGSGAALRAGAGEGTYKQMLVFSEVLSYVVDNYVDPVDQDRLMNGAYEGLLSGLDAHGAYLSADQVEAWKKGSPLPGADPGVAVLKSGPMLQVVSVAKGSPAQSAGLLAGDQIRKVDGRSVRQMSLDQAIRMLRGPAGTSVTLDLLRVKELKRENLTLARAERSDPPFVLDVDGTVGVLHVEDIDRLPNEALERELASVKDRGVDRVLVDLRDAASVDTRRAAAIADLFASGEMLKLHDKSGKAVETLGAKRAKPAWTGRVAVLVNGATAGAGEGLAMILKDRRKAVVYGDSTYGLGTEPKLIELPEGGGLLIPGYIWETPSGAGWNGEGIVPDRVMKGEVRSADTEDEQLLHTIEDFAKSESATSKAA
ncbi:MAG TPA: S41 family peptidase [Candidatus Sulfotelmatobacter sp.]|jgi:carboxyl-terminal processing protease|nr:S41 family peptidase [Candidatus Sulfotelmatobacter sp.]